MKIVRTRLATLAATSALLGSGLLWSASPAHATMPGTNGRIACASTRDGNSEIYTFDPAGTEVQATRITNNSAFDGRPRYSPDGRKIAFESNRDGPTEIYIMDAQVTAPGANAPTDGTNVRRLTFTGSPGHGNSSPSWSPGGDQIAFQSTRTGQFQVFKINIDGTGETQLTNEAAESTLPAWSPDGAKIAFSSRRDDPSADVYTMNPDGTGVVNLTHSPGEDSWPTWSPDGTMIAFHSRRDDPQGEEIYRMNAADGSNVVRLTFNVGPFPPGFDVFPFWSPDGTRIGWESGRTGDLEAFTMRATDGGDIRQITSVGSNQRCDWQPLCTIYGSGKILGSPGNDIICGSDGPDFISGGGGNDRILGLGGDDRIAGGPGNDAIFGGAGNDSISGGGGNDIIDGGTGFDRCVGGPTVRNCEAVG